jgi:hypothetical protein
MLDVYIPSGSKLKHWQSLCWWWIGHFEHFTQMANYGDAPHVYLEDGNKHLLSIAATQCGYATMRETYGGRKGSDAEARLDLCLFNNYETELVEAKWCEFDGAIETPINKLHGKLNEAYREASVFENTVSSIFNESNRSITRIGVLFITPWFDPNFKDNTQSINSMIKKMQSTLSFDIMSYCFPEKPNALKTYYGERLYPGVFLLAKTSLDYFGTKTGESKMTVVVAEGFSPP